MDTSRSTTRSPIRQPVRRVAGESLQWMLVERHILGLAYSVMLSSAFVALAAYEWYRTLLAPSPMPYLFTATAVIASMWAWWRVRRIMAAAGNVRLGIEGERAVADALASLVADGYAAFHDLPGARGDCNIDHVLAGPAGVFVIETKTRRKPVENAREAKVRYDGQAVRVGDGPRDPGPVAQARAAAEEVRRYLEGSTGLKVRVRPVVLYPGWYVELEAGAKAAGGDATWVLNELAFLRWVLSEESRRGVLPQADLRLITDRLERWPVQDA